MGTTVASNTTEGTGATIVRVATMAGFTGNLVSVRVEVDLLPTDLEFTSAVIEAPNGITYTLWADQSQSTSSFRQVLSVTIPYPTSGVDSILNGDWTLTLNDTNSQTNTFYALRVFATNDTPTEPGSGPGNVITTRMRALNLSRAMGSYSGLRARLFVNDFTPLITSVLADFTEPTFSGYAIQPISVTPNSSLSYAPNALISGDNGTIKFDAVEWQNLGASIVTVYGVFVTDVALSGNGDVAAAVKFATARQISPGGKLNIPLDWLSLNS